MSNCKLPVPIFFGNKKYTDCEYELPTGGVFANVNKTARSGDYFSALRSFLIGCIKLLMDSDGNIVEDSIQLKSLISKMPTRTADYISTMILVEYNDGDDEIEGIYSCPRCYHKIIAENKIIDGMEMNTCDHVSDLAIGYWESENDKIQVDLSKPVKFYNPVSKEILREINSFEMRFPTLEDGINAFVKYGGQDEIRLQFQMFINAIISIDGEDVDNKWKNAHGMMMFESIKSVKKDLSQIIGVIKKYGINPEREKTCPECGKVFNAAINTTSFFVRALQSI
jgi:hypothetical protein